MQQRGINIKVRAWILEYELILNLWATENSSKFLVTCWKNGNIRWVCSDQRVRWTGVKATDLGDYTSYYCSYHLFSLAPGMVAMATAHSRPIGGDPAVLCISWCARDEGRLFQGQGSPWWGRVSISAPGPKPLSFSPFPPSTVQSQLSSCLIRLTLFKFCDGAA